MLGSGAGDFFSREAIDGSGTVGKLCGLNARQRLYGFIACFSVGCIMALFSVFALVGTPNLKTFAVTYSIGNLAMLFSTFFLIGPLRQLKLMTSKNRLLASIVYVVMLILTLVLAMTAKFSGLGLVIFLLIIIQTAAMFWYCLTYIPFGQSMLKRVCCSWLGA